MDETTAFDQPNWQPCLQGATIHTTPLEEKDFEALFQVASDPEIWAQHPVRDRYTLPRFTTYFRTGIESNGAILVRDNATHAIIGASRFVRYDATERRIEIGYTFLGRAYWGKGTNSELKRLMLEYALQFVDTVEFVVGVSNFRSRYAMEKLGGKLTRTLREIEPEGDLRESVVYEIYKGWTAPSNRQDART